MRYVKLVALVVGCIAVSYVGIVLMKYGASQTALSRELYGLTFTTAGAIWYASGAVLFLVGGFVLAILIGSLVPTYGQAVGFVLTGIVVILTGAMVGRFSPRLVNAMSTTQMIGLAIMGLGAIGTANGVFQFIRK